jgi:hypothetical protein
MTRNTSNEEFTSETPLTGAYVKADEAQGYEAGSNTVVNSETKIKDLMESRTAYCSSNSLCHVRIEVNLSEIDNRRFNYDLNKRIRGEK